MLLEETNQKTNMVNGLQRELELALSQKDLIEADFGRTKMEVAELNSRNREALQSQREGFQERIEEMEAEMKKL